MVYKENLCIPIPLGFKHVTGARFDGFTIRATKSRNEYVWVPTDVLNNDGTIDGVNYCTPFGRRRWSDGIINEDYHENIPEEHIASVQKYQGFYISRYPISRHWYTGNPQARKGRPISCSYASAVELAKNVEEGNSNIQSHLVYGAEWDSMIAWLIKSGALTTNPAGTCAYGTDKNQKYHNQIWGLATPSTKLTQEQYMNFYCVARGNKDSVTSRRSLWHHRLAVESAFYVALTIIK
jgi:hypothetical protein